MFIIAAIILFVLNANAVAVPAWLLITAAIIGGLELGFYVLALVISVLAGKGIAGAFKRMDK